MSIFLILVSLIITLTPVPAQSDGSYAELKGGRPLYQADDLARERSRLYRSYSYNRCVWFALSGEEKEKLSSSSEAISAEVLEEDFKSARATLEDLKVAKDGLLRHSDATDGDNVDWFDQIDLNKTKKKARALNKKLRNTLEALRDHPLVIAEAPMCERVLAN